MPCLLKLTIMLIRSYRFASVLIKFVCVYTCSSMFTQQALILIHLQMHNLGIYRYKKESVMIDYYLLHKRNQSTQQHILRHKYHWPGYMKHCYYNDQHICVHNNDRTIHGHNLHHNDQLPCYTDRCLCSVQNNVVYNQGRTIHLDILQLCKEESVNAASQYTYIKVRDT